MALTQDRLKELMKYDPETGVFTALVRTGGRVVPGTVLGTLKDGYVRISVDGKLYYAHRLAFLYMTGVMPDEVDHDDRDRGNNRWENLKETTHSDNAVNTPVRKHSSTGIKGITPHQGKFVARFKKKYIGIFNTPEEAHAAYLVAGGRA